MKKAISSLMLLSFLSLGAFAQRSATDITGKWKTIDDKTGKAKSIVQIYEQGGKAYGKVIEILNPDRKDAVCDKCADSDSRKNQRIDGMIIMMGLEKCDDDWDDGTILDPDNGKVYDCKMWVGDDGKLQVRGYIGWSLIGRTQVWLPMPD